MLPTQYQWLDAVGPLPRMLVEALKLLDTREQPGPGNNVVIMGWANEVGLQKTYSADAVPWCGLFMAVVAKRAGKPLPKDPLWALNWLKFGEDSGQPDLGDVVVFVREGGGHVGLYVGEDRAAYHVLGGNQSDRVCFTRIEKKRLKGARRFYAVGAPPSVRPYFLEAAGALSLNEA